ncbi:MAG: transcriptional regulator [Burkholderiales bacterium RIFCSPLOWO2_02_FULL_57_36]|nr:MAG: transcriptional regulator [Burkholderiales bacterium RIFCSPLOWO2_02_FULL_57_36]
MDKPSPSRQKAVDAAIAVLDTTFFNALQEPARIAVLRRLMLLGRADIGQIAEGLPQERSVISRHLQVLLEAGIVRCAKEGRHRYYEVDGPAVLRNLEAITRQLAAVAPFCCPATDPG